MRGGQTESEAKPRSSAEWSAPPRIPGYRIEAPLGQGGTAAVFRAIREQTGEAIALKVLSSERAEDLGAAMARLEREAHIGRALAHPDIVPVIDFGRTEDLAWIAMELLDGFELTHALPDPSLGFEDRVGVVLRVAAALEHAHAHGVVHRDVKPSNIYMTRAGGVRLLDFGIAHVKVDLRITQSGVIVGTPRYMAPEQVMGDDVDPRTDVFSLGVVLYQALSGAMPWSGETAARLIIEIATQPPRPLQGNLPSGAFGLDPQAVEQLCAVVHRAIASAPEDRYATMAEFSDALAPFVAPGARAARSEAHADGAWSQRRVDWALARAARLQAERQLGVGEMEPRASDPIDETLSDRPDRVWLTLILAFGLALAAAIYIVLT